MTLTKVMKDAIINKMVKEKFDPLFKAQDEKEHSFANGLVDAALAAVDLGPIRLEEFPDGCFPDVSSVYTTWDGWAKRLQLGRVRRVTYKIGNDGMRFGVDDPAFKQEADLKQDRHNLEAQEKELRREISAVLQGIRTVKKLSEMWPEAAAYAPKIPAPVPVVVDLSRVKKLLEG